MKKKIASVLCLVLLVSLLFTGCFAPKLEGKWQGQIDITDAMNSYLTQDDDYSFPDLRFEDIQLPISLEFTAEGRCILTIDDADVTAVMIKLVEQLMPALEAQIEALGMNMESLAALSGMTVDELKQELAKELATSTDLASLNADEEYTAEDGKLTIGDMEGLPYTLKGDQLTISYEGDEEFAFMFPMQLQRVKE